MSLNNLFSNYSGRLGTKSPTKEYEFLGMPRNRSCRRCNLGLLTRFALYTRSGFRGIEVVRVRPWCRGNGEKGFCRRVKLCRKCYPRTRLLCQGNGRTPQSIRPARDRAAAYTEGSYGKVWPEKSIAAGVEQPPRGVPRTTFRCRKLPGQLQHRFLRYRLLTDVFAVSYVTFFIPNQCQGSLAESR